MNTPLDNLVKKLSDIERTGITIEALSIDSQWSADEDHSDTVTGKTRPAGRFYSVSMNITVPVEP